MASGSKRAFPIRKGGVFTGRVAVVDANPKAKDWKTDIQAFAQSVYKGPLLSMPLLLRLVFWMPRPKWHFRTGKNAGQLKGDSPTVPRGKPDLLKLASGDEDALTNILWLDDAQITEEQLSKRYATDEQKPGVWITIATVGDS